MMVIINLIANIIITIAITFFIIGVFGRKAKKIEDMPLIEQYFLRFALTTLASGSLLNVLSFATPHTMSEVILDCGLAMLFSWAAWFHWTYFVRCKQK